MKIKICILYIENDINHLSFIHLTLYVFVRGRKHRQEQENEILVHSCLATNFSYNLCKNKVRMYRVNFPVWLRNRLLSSGLKEPVLSQTEKQTIFYEIEY